jgi:hypothetical protein
LNYFSTVEYLIKIVNPLDQAIEIFAQMNALISFYIGAFWYVLISNLSPDILDEHEVDDVPGCCTSTAAKTKAIEK